MQRFKAHKTASGHGKTCQSLKRRSTSVSYLNPTLSFSESVFLYSGGHAWQGNRGPIMAAKADDFMLQLQQAFGSRRVIADDSADLGSTS